MNREELKKPESADDDWEQFIQQTLGNQRLIKAGKQQPVRKELQGRIASEAAVGLRMPGEPTLKERLQAIRGKKKKKKNAFGGKGSTFAGKCESSNIRKPWR